MNFKIVEFDSSVAVEVNDAKKIKTKGVDYKNIIAKGVVEEPVMAPSIETPVAPVETRKEVVKETPVVPEHRYSFEEPKPAPVIPEWRDASEKTPRSTVVDTIPNISLVDSTRETYVGLKNKLSKDDDPIQYAVVSNGLAMVDKKEHEKELLIEKRNSGKNECEGMVSSKESQIRELKTKFESELAVLEKQLESLKANGESYLESMNAKIKAKETEIIDVYKAMKVELSKAEKADTKTKEANTLRLQQTEIVGNIDASFLKGITEPEESQTPVSIRPFDSYRIDETPRRTA